MAEPVKSEESKSSGETWQEFAKRTAPAECLKVQPFRELKTFSTTQANLIKPRSSRRLHIGGEMNRLERLYAEYLTNRHRAGEIRDWRFEAMKLRLAKATFFDPDFTVVLPDGRVELHEVKGHWEDDARVKIKVAAQSFPWFAFLGVQWDKQLGWKFERFG